MSNKSNRSRADKGRQGRAKVWASVPSRMQDHSKHSRMGISSLVLSSGMRDTSRAVVKSKGKARGLDLVLASRIPGQWSDTYHHKPATFASYHIDAWTRANCVRTRINPSRETSNKQRLLVWSSKLQRPVRRSFQIPGTEPGSVYQSPAEGLVMRGERCLFDVCLVTPAAPNTRKHKPCGVLPPFSIAPIVKRGKLELDAAVIAWRHAQVNAYYEALIVWRS